MTAETAPVSAGKREWMGLAVLALTAMLVSFDLFVLLLALPHLSADLGATGVEQLWITDIYGFLVGGFLITMGGLGDRIGRRRLLLYGALAFGVASVLSAYAANPGMLIAGRALLGVAGATLTPSTLSLVRAMFRDQRQLNLAVGIWSGCFTVGAILGPIAGGVMLSYFWWGSVFLLAVPVMAALLVLGPKVLPEYRDPDAGRLDPMSALLSLAAILPLVYGIKEAARYGIGVLPVAAFVAGAVATALFLRRQRRLPDPLLDLALFRPPEFRIGMLGLLAYSLLTGGVMFLMTQWFQSVAGLSPLQAGVAMVPGMAMFTVSATVAPVVARRVRPAFLIGGGLLLVVAALVWLTELGPHSPTVVPILAFALWTIGGGPVQALGVGMILSTTPPEKAGSASAMPQVSNEIGGAVGFAVLGTVAMAVYRERVGGAVPDDVPVDSATTATESVAGAVSVARTLAAPARGDLLDAARDAFTGGVHVASWIAAALLAGTATLIMVRLRHLPPLRAQRPSDGASEVESDQGTHHER